jgi:hypothetical protein
MVWYRANRFVTVAGKPVPQAPQSIRPNIPTGDIVIKTFVSKRADAERESQGRNSTEHGPSSARRP